MPKKPDVVSVSRVFGLLAAVECMLFAAAVSGGIGVWLGILAHGMLVMLTADWLRRHLAGDRALGAIGVLATGIAGPLGALCVMLLAIAEQHARPSHELLAAWYRRVSGDHSPDQAEQIHEAIVTGRAARSGSAESRRFAKILEAGTLPEKQALLAVIGLKYHNDYFPILGAALRHRDACVRAQAAAVFVKLKEEFKSRLKSHVAFQSVGTGPNDSEESIRRVHAILSCTASGFIEPAVARDAHAAAKALCTRAIRNGQAAGATETLRCRVLAADGEHLDVVNILQSRLPTTLDPEARVLLANSMIALGHHRGLHELLKQMNVDMAGQTGRAVRSSLAAAELALG